MSAPLDTDKPPVARSADARASVWGTARTIAWSFIGVRNGKGHAQDGTRVNPLHVVVAGFVGVFLLVAGLMVLVNWVAA